MKKTLKLLSVSAAVFALALSTALALPSQTANGAVVGVPTVNGKPVEGLKVQFEDVLETAPEEQKTAIEQMNSGKALVEVLADEKVVTPDNVELKDLKALTEVQDLVARDANGNVLKDVKNITITWEVPNLTKGIGEVHVLHYSTVRNVWEVLTPSQVDYENKTITTTFPDLSPVSVVYVPAKTTEGGNKGDSVNTGDSSNVMLYAGLAIVALAAIGAVTYKTKKEN